MQETQTLRIPGDWRRPSKRESFALTWHEDLGYGELLPRPTRAEVARFYEVPGRYYTHTRGANGLPPEREALHWRLLRRCFHMLDRGAHPEVDYYLPLLPARGGLVLDIGSGGGRLLEDFAGRGVWAIGVEPDAAARAVSAARGVHEIDGTAEELPDSIADGSVRLVNLSHVLEHCIEPATALRAIHDKLAPGGVLVAEVPNNECAGARQHQACWHFLDVPRHLNFFTTASLVRMVEEAGLVVERIEYCGYGRQVMREWLETQRLIHEAFVAMGATDLRDRNSFRDAVALLARTAFARPERKYDSVRVVARKETPAT